MIKLRDVQWTKPSSNSESANFTLSPSPVAADGVPKCLLQDELASPNVLAT